MSPWMTISRCSSARYSPGTFCQAGSPLCWPKPIVRSAVALGEEDAPAVVLHRHVAEVRPALAADVDRGAQVDVLGRQRRAHRLPPVEEVRLPGLQRALQPAVLVQVDVVRDLLGVVGGRGHGWHQTRFRSKSARWPVPNLRSAPSGPDGVGPVEDPVLPGGQPAEDLGLHRLRAGEAVVRLQAGQRVRAEAGALLERDAHLLVPVDVVGGEGDQAELGRVLGVQRLARPLLDRGERVLVAEEAGLQPGQPVAHRQRAEVHRADGDRRRARRPGRSSSNTPASWKERSAASASSSSEPAKHAARLDQRDQAAAGHVEPLQRALEVVHDLVGEPVVGVVEQAAGRSASTAPRRPRCGTPRCRARSRWCAGRGSGRRARG